MPETRVLILADYADIGGAASGGAGAMVSQSHRALIEAGIGADLVTGFGPVPAGATSLEGEDLREAGRGGGLRSIWNRPAAAALTRLLAQHDPARTLVILHQWTRWLSPAALVPLRRFPLLVYCHDYFWACPNGAYFHFPDGVPCDRQPLGPRCLTAQCDRASAAVKLARVARQVALVAARSAPGPGRVLLHVSDRARRLMASLLPDERHELVHNPLPGPPPRLPAPGAAPPVHRDLCYVGRLEPEKGVLELARQAVAHQWSALFVGEGRSAAALAAMPGITVRGWQPREAVTAAMRSCRILVLPSLWPETWGLTVAEAMAAGVPVLVSARAGSAELVERFGGGRVFDPARPGELAARARAMLAVPPRPIDAMAAFHDLLSPERHARQIATIARRHFHLELGGAVSGARSSLPAGRPAAPRHAAT